MELTPAMRALAANLEDALGRGVRSAFPRERAKRPAVLPVAVLL